MGDERKKIWEKFVALIKLFKKHNFSSFPLLLYAVKRGGIEREKIMKYKRGKKVYAMGRKKSIF